MKTYKQFIEAKQKPVKKKPSVKRYSEEDDDVEKGRAVDPSEKRLLSQKLKQHKKVHGKDDKKLKGQAAKERDYLRDVKQTQDRSYRKRYGWTTRN